MALQPGEVIERIGLAQFAGVDQTHKQVPRLSSIECAVKQRILAMQNGALQRPLADGSYEHINVSRRVSGITIRSSECTHEEVLVSGGALFSKGQPFYSELDASLLPCWRESQDPLIARKLSA